MTGSRRYGTPRPDSDIDLVVLTSDEAIAKLHIACDSAIDLEGEPGGEYKQIRFGSLNIIALTDEDEFRAWEETSAALEAKRPVSRDYAKEAITKAVERASEPHAHDCPVGCGSTGFACSCGKWVHDGD